MERLGEVKNEKVTEPAKELEVTGLYDTVVAGGGVAGIAAALAAARNGSKTLLLEKEWLLGGLGTLGLIAIYLPLCDGNGRQVIYGIGEELFKLSISYGVAEGHFPNPVPWLSGGSLEEKKAVRYQAQYHPYMFALCAERLLREAGVTILYGTSVCAVDCKDGRINALITENKSGRRAIRAKTVVDATGDADICRFAGADTVLFKAGNILASWHYFFREGQMTLRMMGAAESFSDNSGPEGREKEGFREDDVVLLKNRRFSGVCGTELSEMVQLSHKSLLDCTDTERLTVPDYVPVIVPTIPQIRMTRRLDGEYAQSAEEAFVHYDDSVGMTGDWRKAGPVYEIPFRGLYSKSVKNLITAGRCISVTDSMWDITRVIPTCAVTGQAAGTAAALAARDKGGDITKLPVSLLQEQLKRDGALLFLDDLDKRNGL